jgi:poly-beta-1,6-N-acetyl-D-glucosamine synthase
VELLNGILSAVNESTPYFWILVFFGAYPITMALVWIVLSLTFKRRTEFAELPPLEKASMVSVLVPAYCEELTIGRTLEALLELDYPNYEVIVINDGSQDRTAEVVKRYIPNGPIRLLDKKVNEGKSMALNDGLAVCNGEIILVIDADILVDPKLLSHMVPHFSFPRVAAVTGNPRVQNRQTLLQNLQAIEFSSIISMQRRAQRIWGRVMTVSGAVFAVRRSALLELGDFSPEMATEDIDMTWQLQLKFWDVRYEPRAVVWMEAPPNLRELWKQRRRWALGLAQVLRKNALAMLNWKTRRLWPVFIESSFSILWAYTFVGVTAFWLLCLLAGVSPYGASPIPNLWGMTIASACLVQLLVGALSDRRYDPKIMRSYPDAIFYPLVYWMLMSTITAIYTMRGFFGRRQDVQRWKIQRSAA